MRAIIALLFAVTGLSAAAQTPQTVYLQTFENGLGGWTIDNFVIPRPGHWRLSSGCLAGSGDHSTPFAMQYTIPECGYYDGTTEGYAYSSAIDLTGYTAPFTLTFNYRLATEDISFESASVWVSSNGINFTMVAQNRPGAGTVQLWDPTGWTTSASVDISALVSTQAYVLFAFHGDPLFEDPAGFYFDDVEIQGVPEADPAQIWVDFAYVGTESGSEVHPFNSLPEGVDAVNAGGTVKIKAGSSPDPITITKALTLAAPAGVVLLGSPARSAAAASGRVGGRGEVPDVLPQGTALPLESIPEHIAGLTRGAPRMNSISPLDVSPSSIISGNLVSAGPGDTLSVRLSPEGPIDPDSVWHTVLAAEGQEAEVYWEPDESGSRSDIWVRCVPLPEWEAGDVVTVTAGAFTRTGEPVAPVTWHFQISDE